MILTETQIQQVMEKTKLAFPNFTDWESNNEKNSEYWGFSLWGEYRPDPEALMPKRFFVTLETYEDKWRGCLTIGQHSYFWSSADFGDAHLLSTDDYDLVEEAIAALKAEILKLFKAFSVSSS